MHVDSPDSPLQVAIFLCYFGLRVKGVHSHDVRAAISARVQPIDLPPAHVLSSGILTSLSTFWRVVLAYCFPGVSSHSGIGVYARN